MLTLGSARIPSAGTLLLLVLGALLVAACGRDRLPALPRDATVLVVGDSISAGFGVDAGQAWPALLAGHSGWKVVNGGVNGDLSADALERLPALLEQHAPRLVVLEIGGNDLLRGVPEGRIRSNLERMIAAAQAAGAQVVLLAVPRPSLMGAALSALRPADFYRAVAADQGVLLVEDALSAILSRPDFRLDPLHPNGAGHAALAREVADALRESGLLR